jgi:hypothetical protein
MNKKYLRKNIYVNQDQIDLFTRLQRRFKVSGSELVRMGLEALRGEPTKDDILTELGVEFGALCPDHGIFYSSCWEKHK